MGGTLTRSERPEVKFTATQPLFAGFREFYAWNGLKSLKHREELSLVNAKKALDADAVIALAGSGYGFATSGQSPSLMGRNA